MVAEPFLLSISSTDDPQIQIKDLITFQSNTFHEGVQHLPRPFLLKTNACSRNKSYLSKSLQRVTKFIFIATCHNQLVLALRTVFKRINQSVALED